MAASALALVTPDLDPTQGQAPSPAAMAEPAPAPTIAPTIAPAPVAPVAEVRPVGNLKDGRPDSGDPFKLFMYEATRAELLTHEGEIALGQRVEAGRLTVLESLARIPSSYAPLADWRSGVLEGRILLRNLLDISMAEPAAYAEGIEDEVAAAAEELAALQNADADEGQGAADTPADTDTDDDDEGAGTLRAKEAKLMPAVIARIDRLARLHAELAPIFKANWSAAAKGRRVGAARSERLEGLAKAAARELEALKLDPTRVSELTGAVYASNKAVMAAEGRLLRLVQAARIDREAFLEAYTGRELDEGLLAAWGGEPDSPWGRLVARHGNQLGDILAEIREAAAAHRTPVQELRKLAAASRRGERVSREALDEMVRANLRLVVSIARPYAQMSPLPLADLVQEGNLGLIRGCAKYEWRRGFRLSTYVSWWIRQSVQRAIADQSRTIRVPVHMYDNLRKVMREQRLFKQEQGREPTVEELAERTVLSPEVVRRALPLSSGTVSLDTPVGEEQDATLGDLVEDKNARNPHEEAEAAGLGKVCSRALEALTAREERILRMRFGIGGGEEHTLEEVGKIFGVTRERIRQIEAKALRKLRHPTRSKSLRSFLDVPSA